MALLESIARRAAGDAPGDQHEVVAERHGVELHEAEERVGREGLIADPPRDGPLAAWLLLSITSSSIARPQVDRHRAE